MKQKTLVFILLMAMLSCLAPAPAQAFYSNGRWTTTALDGTTGPLGTSVNVTWSLVPDGTFIPGEGGSNLIAFMDGLFGNGGGGTDYTSRPWFHFFEDSFDRWSELSGLTFYYEDNDDGANLRGLLGAENVRGDVRIGGAYIDGNGGTYASASFLLDADLTIDTGDTTHYSNSLPFGNYQNMRNTFMHEIGHALGLGHIESTTSVFLLEPFPNAGINGPQLDDIRGVHHLYGDVNEKGVGNNTLGTATVIEVLPGTPILQGEHASTGTFVLMAEADFLSISNQNDYDYFSFEISNPALLDLTVTPLGANYNERVEGTFTYTTTFSSAVSNLSLELYRVENGTPVLLSSRSANPTGQQESILDFLLVNPGEYAFRVAGSTSVIQLYQFAMELETVVIDPMDEPGDFDGDGDVDGRDFLAWQQGESAEPFSVEDLDTWQVNYGFVEELIGSSSSIPEPTVAMLLLPLALGFYGFKRASGKRSLVAGR